MKRLIIGLMMAVVCGAGQIQGALIVNGGFNGDLNGWTQNFNNSGPSYGELTTVLSASSEFSETNKPTVLPTEGSHFALLEAAVSGINYGPDNGSPNNYLATAVLEQVITVEVGDRIVGDYFASLWKDGDNGSSEFSVVLYGVGGAPSEVVVHPRTWPWPGGDTIETVYIPWTEFEYTFDTAGDYRLMIYVQLHSRDPESATAFAGVDNIRFEAATVPEPSTFIIWCILGGLGLIAARRGA